MINNLDFKLIQESLSKLKLLFPGMDNIQLIVNEDYWSYTHTDNNEVLVIRIGETNLTGQNTMDLLLILSFISGYHTRYLEINTDI